jgi:hypothetical protein
MRRLGWYQINYHGKYLFIYFLIVSFLCSGRLPQAPLDKRHPDLPRKSLAK